VKAPELLPLFMQFMAEFAVAGDMYPPPAAEVDAGKPML